MIEPGRKAFDAIAIKVGHFLTDTSELPLKQRDEFIPVDWSIVKVAEVVYCRNESDDTWFLVTLEGASPSSRLAPRIQCELGAAFPHWRFRVECRW